MVSSLHAKRRSSGTASIKLLVWIVILFGAYAGYKLIGVNTVESNLERAVDDMFGNVKLDSTHESIKNHIIRKVAVASIELDPESIRVETERRTGELLIEVKVEHPVTISFLGSEKTLMADVHLTRAIAVDEAALARQAKHQRRVDEHWNEVRDAMAECKEQWGRGNCQLTETPGAALEVVRDY